MFSDVPRIGLAAVATKQLLATKRLPASLQRLHISRFCSSGCYNKRLSALVGTVQQAVVRYIAVGTGAGAVQAIVIILKLTGIESGCPLVALTSRNFYNLRFRILCAQARPPPMPALCTVLLRAMHRKPHLEDVGIVDGSAPNAYLGTKFHVHRSVGSEDQERPYWRWCVNACPDDTVQCSEQAWKKVCRTSYVSEGDMKLKIAKHLYNSSKHNPSGDDGHWRWPSEEHANQWLEEFLVDNSDTTYCEEYVETFADREKNRSWMAQNGKTIELPKKVSATFDL